MLKYLFVNWTDDKAICTLFTRVAMVLPYHHRMSRSKPGDSAAELETKNVMLPRRRPDFLFLVHSQK